MAVAVVLVAAAVVLGWSWYVVGPMPEAMEALVSDADVAVSTERWLTFAPVGTEPTTGFIFYPGGRVDPRSYAPPARAIAAAGHLAVVVPMPLHLAVLGADRAADVMTAHPDIRSWVVGGHSLGGAMAAQYAMEGERDVDGLVLWAAYPASGTDLSNADVMVLSVYGTRDMIATPLEIEASRPLLPPSAVWTAIEGGNHAQFGWYGPQGGDGAATITREEQQAQVVAATLDVLNALPTP